MQKMQIFNGKKPVRKAVTADEFNELMFQNIGLDVDDEGIVIDEDIEVRLMIRGKLMTTDESLVQPGIILFDPAGDPSIMDKLFKHYVQKHDMESGVSTRSVAYGTCAKNEKSYIELIKVDGKKYKSGNFYNDNIKCGDLIIQLNSDINVYDFTELDEELFKQAKFLEEQRKKEKQKRRSVSSGPKVI